MENNNKKPTKSRLSKIERIQNSLNKDKVEVTHINLNDNTVEGLKYKNKNL